MVSWDTANSTHYEPTHFLSAFASFAKIIRYQQLPASSTAEQRHHLLSLGQAKKKPPKTWVHDPKLNGSPIRTSQTQVAKHIYGICYIKYGYKYICVTICVYIYIYELPSNQLNMETNSETRLTSSKVHFILEEILPDMTCGFILGSDLPSS